MHSDCDWVLDDAFAIVRGAILGTRATIKAKKMAGISRSR